MAAELIPLKTGLGWIRELWTILRKYKGKYEKEIQEISDAVLCDPLEIAEYYVEPECQDSNPADHPDEDFPVAKEPIMKRINQFFQFKPSHTGGDQMLVLSDAGMGKTALLTMLRLLHLTAFLPKEHDCVLKKLGKTTLDEVAKIENKRDTILLLDSLDEDSEAFGHVQERLISILEATRQFRKTIITCRTQFFPKNEGDPFKRPGMVKISGFICPAKYLSFFSVQKVEEFLLKRFPKKYLFFTDKQKIEEAQRVIAKMGALRCRPMLLSYIEDLMAMSQIKDKDSEYHIYDALVQSWLIRQENKPDAKVSVKELLPACIILAAIMQIREKRSISEQDLDALIDKIKDVFPVTKIDIKGKSLINRNSDGDYRFSHFSIQEFLVAKLLLEKPDGKYWFTPKQNHKIRMTDFIVRMMVVSGKVPNFIELIDFNGIKDLRGINLSGADLSGIDFSDVNFSGANLSNANLRGANLSNAKFDGAKLESSQCEPVFSFKENLGMVFVYIPPGEFMMGSPKGEPGRYDNETPHKVTLTKGFYMQTTQITQRQWQTVMGNNPSYFKNGGDNCPVENVSWDDAQEFIRKLNEKEGSSDKYRLPTEAEWEYAARAGTQTAIYAGDMKILGNNNAPALDPIAWYGGNSGVDYDGGYDSSGWKDKQYDHKRAGTHPVGKKKPNDFSLYDMIGNVWEWCQDWYGEYAADDVTDPGGPSSGSDRVLRGGSWGSYARICRTANRGSSPPGNRDDSSGFRLVHSQRSAVRNSQLSKQAQAGSVG